MKDIKFRAWNTENKTMWCHETIKRNGIFALDSNLPNKEFLVIPVGKQVELMQFVGLTDKNGNEIYEGDILKFPDTGEEGYEYKEGYDFMNVAKVVFENGRFELTDFISDNSGVLDEMNDCHEDFISVFGSAEVIGNIYENPELLNT